MNCSSCRTIYAW
ncbi:hypothetical protein DZB85_18175 [Bacillus sp. LB(2018)]|nr:hypothetical protein DZB85_18175 [Bacillus sp. LB(2018)]RFB44339.1 hypothetical protein DZB83_20545 [Bacillus sp. dmp10]